MDKDLDRFKQLDLRQVAAWLGYAIDERKSSRNSTVMRKDHDKIIISRKAEDGHYTYWSPRCDQDRGTVVDFLQRRKGLTPGGVRLQLRAWASLPAPPLPHLPALSESVKDLDAVRKRYEAMPFADRYPFLEEVRGIPAEILRHPRFMGRVKAGRYGAAVFPHVDADGRLCGYEVKSRLSNGRTWHGFAANGRKGVFLSNATNSDRRLVLTENAVDALSYAALFGGLDVTRYGSIAGKPTPWQHSVMRATMAAMPPGSEIVAATDADEAGRRLATEMKAIFDQCARVDLTFHRDEPVGGKDWNEILIRQSKPGPPRRPEEPRVA